MGPRIDYLFSFISSTAPTFLEASVLQNLNKVMDFIRDLANKFKPDIPVHMDFQGQKRAERTFQVIIILFAVVGFVWGYICQQFSQTVYILGAGFTLSCLLTLPPWPMYRRSPLEWQKAREEETTQEPSQKSGKSGDKHKSKKKK